MKYSYSCPADPWTIVRITCSSPGRADEIIVSRYCLNQGWEGTGTCRCESHPWREDHTASLREAARLVGVRAVLDMLRLSSVPHPEVRQVLS